MNEPVTLEQVAAEREKVRRRLERSRELLELLRPDFEEAQRNVRADAEELARIDLAMGSVTRAYLIAAAVDAAGLDTEDPPVVVVPHRPLPIVWELVAVGAGVGLYRYTPERSHRYQGREFALRVEHVPALVLGLLDAQRFPDTAAMKELLGPGVEGQVRRVHPAEQSGLVTWQSRSKGDFGFNGPVKPLKPPGAPRWRWLKVAESQTALAAGE
jgi:hypothetical protein